MAKAKVKADGKKGGWEIFTVRYQNPKFGTEGKEFLPDIHNFMVSTQGGSEDARAAFEKFHPGCRAIIILDHMSASMDESDNLFMTKQALAKLK